jgi:exosortase/archaeosortase family protein
MKSEIAKFVQKYKITPARLIVFLIIALLLSLRFLVQNKVYMAPVEMLLSIYGDLIMAMSKVLLAVTDADLVFDFAKNQLVSQGKILKIDRFYFSINQLFAALAIVLLTKSPYFSKIKAFLIAFVAITCYNSLRVSLHALYPETISTHNWFFNLLLIPRWILVIAFAYYYWQQYPFVHDLITKKFGFAKEFILSTYKKAIFIIIAYHIVAVIAFNNLFFINGSQLIALVLHVSQYVLEILGYASNIDNRLIYSEKVYLYMDDACLGINLKFLFASFIVLLPGARKHKYWYIPAGLIVIVLLNCLRVILIFINISKYGHYNLPFEIHDLFSYPVLVFTFFMWVIWINKFFIPYKKRIEDMKQRSTF